MMLAFKRNLVVSLVVVVGSRQAAMESSPPFLDYDQASTLDTGYHDSHMVSIITSLFVAGTSPSPSGILERPPMAGRRDWYW